MPAQERINADDTGVSSDICPTNKTWALTEECEFGKTEFTGIKPVPGFWMFEGEPYCEPVFSTQR